MFVQIAFGMLLVLMPWAADRANGDRLTSFDNDAPATSECASPSQGPSFDDPNVDTDPDRPIMEQVATPGDDGDDSSDDDADGMCLSQTLELWFEREPKVFLQASTALKRAIS
ncbi:MAG: hypothetical protein GC190_02310 [Alphaproteobacteria bacterium]|nr:hypothetical protein [Alphaproteobacteria bacterium]